MDEHTADKQLRLTGEEESQPHDAPSSSSLSAAANERTGGADETERQRPLASSSAAADLYERSALRFAPSLSATLPSSRSTTATMEAWMPSHSQPSPTEDTDPESALFRAIRNASASVTPQPQPQPHLGWNPMGPDTGAEAVASPVQGHAEEVLEGASPYGDDNSEADKATASDKQSGAATGEETDLVQATAAASSAQGGNWHPADGNVPSQLAMGGLQGAIVPYRAPPIPNDSAVLLAPLTPYYYPVLYWTSNPYYTDPNRALIPYAPDPNRASSSTHGNGRAANPGAKRCKYWARAGGCRQGALCRFAHGHLELPNTRCRTNVMCRYVLNGIACPQGQGCPFRHR